jgi:signal transduction histidine kinase
MPKTLYSRLSVALLALFGLIGGLYLAVTLFTTQRYFQEVNQKLNRTLADHLATEKILMREGRIDRAVLEEVFHMLMVINPVIEIYLLDTDGRVLAFSAPPGKVKRQQVSLEPIRRFLDGSAALPILGDDPRDAAHRKIFSAAPIRSDDRLEGYLYVILGGEEYDSVAGMLKTSYILRLSTVMIIGGLLFVLLAGLYLFYLLTRRFRRLTAAMEGFTRTDFSEPVPLYPDDRSGDEIGRLEYAFRRMSGRILEQIGALKQTDRLRRELVANVSHDLRTPLASLQGYLETLLLKEGTLSPEEQRQYLEIAAKHSERLGRLVSELFELAKLDSHETPPRLESFSLGELVQDIAQKFRLSAEKKNVRIETDLKTDLPFVRADIGMIERVFENLLDNALRHTPPGGAVRIVLAAENDRVTVRVSDTGPGIPEEDLPYIFDRFYRVEKHRSDGTGGAGLGLAIAKRILELHGSRIEVSSAPGSGTAFGFHLPIAIIAPSAAS